MVEQAPGRSRRGADGGPSGAHDPRLLPGDVGERGPQPVGVVEVDVGDDGKRRFDGVHGVEAPAQTHLQDRRGDVLPGEVDEGRRRERFEVAGAAGLQVGRQAGQQVVQGLGGDRRAVHLDALAYVQQVGAGEQPHPLTGGLQHPGERPRGAALAVGAADQDHAKRPLRMVQAGDQGANAFEPGGHPPAGQALEQRAAQDRRVWRQAGQSPRNSTLAS